MDVEEFVKDRGQGFLKSAVTELDRLIAQAQWQTSRENPEKFEQTHHRLSQLMYYRREYARALRSGQSEKNAEYLQEMIEHINDKIKELLALP